MTIDNELESLRTDLKSVIDLVKTSAEAKANAIREEILTEIKSLSAEIGKEFKEEDYKDATVETLNYVHKTLRETIELLKKSTDTGDLAGLISRGDVSSLNKEEIEDILIDLICLAYNLPIAPDEVKEEIRYERMASGQFLR